MRISPGPGAQLTVRQLRARFTMCPKWPAASDQGSDEGGARKPGVDTQRGHECRAAVARQIHSEPDADTLLPATLRGRGLEGLRAS